jgi:hypothetical protein
MTEFEYLQAVSPTTLFKNKKEVKEFLDEPGTIEDLKCFLRCCEEEELFEYCCLIRDKINEKL